jgi:hypothetical protein
MVDGQTHAKAHADLKAVSHYREDRPTPTLAYGRG